MAGVVATGTHGSGKEVLSLASLVVGGRLVTGSGEVVEFGEDDGELLRAARVSLGALGILTHLRLRLVPAFRIQRREYCTTVDACLGHLDQLIDENRSFDFYWYPRSDEVKLRLLNVPGGGTSALPYATLVEEHTGWAHEVIPKHSHLPHRFEEMEYALPAAAGPECFREVRERVKAEHRRCVGWRVLYRTVAAEDALLSTAHCRPIVTISLRQNASLPFWGYFTAIEPLFRSYGGRPHWAKKHTLRAGELRPLYPAWDRFLAVRRRLDPHGCSSTPTCANCSVWRGHDSRDRTQDVADSRRPDASRELRGGAHVHQSRQALPAQYRRHRGKHRGHDQPFRPRAGRPVPPDGRAASATSASTT